MSLTRRQLVVRSGRRRRLGRRRRRVAAERLGAFDAPPPFDRSEFPEPGRSAVAVLRAQSYDGDLEGLLLDGLRLVEADVRGRSVLAQAEPRRVRRRARRSTPTRGSSSPPRTHSGGSARPRSSSPRARGTAATRRPSRSRRACTRRSTTRGLRVRRPERRAARPDAARDPLHGAARALGAARPPRDGGRRLDAEAEDAPLGRRHDVAEELLRLHARPRLRLAEGRLPRPRHPRVDPRHRRRGAAVARDHGRHRRHAGRRPDHGRPGRLRRRRRLARPRRRRRHRRAPDGHGPREGRRT